MTALASRRRVLAAGWAAPSLVVATAAPARATSKTENRLRFTNTTATPGKKPNTLYVNTRIQVIDGPDPVHNLTVTVCVNGSCQQDTWDRVAGWDNTGQIELQWNDLPRERMLVQFQAIADGCTPITNTVEVTAPSWWKDAA